MDMTPLGELIAEVQRAFVDAHGVPLTYGDIARRSGGRLTRGRVQQLAKDPIKAMPSPEVIYGLALGLTVPESVVLERALASAGYTGPSRQRRDEARNAAAMNTQEQAAIDRHRTAFADDVLGPLADNESERLRRPE